MYAVTETMEPWEVYGCSARWSPEVTDVEALVDSAEVKAARERALTVEEIAALFGGTTAVIEVVEGPR